MKQNKLLQRLLEKSTISETAPLAESKFFTEKDMIPTPVPMLNVALSGSPIGGIVPGSTMLAGPSKHFKTGFALVFANAYFTKYPDAVLLFYDSEFGTPQNYFKSFKIPMSQVVHTPVESVEQLKHDLAVQLDEIKRGDHVIIIVDSIGNLASNKELEDALEGKNVADMTRAKAIKSLFRTIGPKLTIKDVPLIAINHTYKEIGLFPKDVVGGGTGSYYNSDNIFIIGRQQEAKGTGADKEIQGYNFILKVEKSRYTKEGSRIPIFVSFENGINKWSGLLELAMEGGFVVRAKAGKEYIYSLVNQKTNEPFEEQYTETEIRNNDKVWKDMMSKSTFTDYITKTYKMNTEGIINEEQAPKTKG